MVIILFAVLLAACAQPRPAPIDTWQAQTLGDHPLVGRIWASESRSFVSASDLLAAADRHFVLLGEKHDNPDHHRIQAWIVAGLAETGRRPSVVFEMIDEGQAEALAEALAEDPIDVAQLGPALDWEKRGWPDWAIYRPVAEAALAQGLEIAPGNISRAYARDIVKRGEAAISAADRQRLSLDRRLPPILYDALIAELAESHCGQLPEDLLPAMARVQHLRDAVMATRLRQHDRGDGAILIAGAGHVRNDRAVPWHLRAGQPKAEIFTLALREVAVEGFDPEDYLERDAAGRASFDFLWFTPRLDLDDPCAAFARQSE
jgi:uncharacterized iron-regulated protein